MMLRAFILIASLALAPMSGALAQGEDQTVYNVILKARIEARGDQITLGDVFENAGNASDVAIANAPAPGQSLSLDPIYVKNQARHHNLFWSNPTDLLRITVERPSRTISANDITTLISESLYMETGDVYEVSLSNRTLTLHAPVESAASASLSDLSHDPYSGLLRATVTAYPGGPETQISGRAFATTQVPVLQRSLSRGDIISAGDIDWVSMRVDRLPSNAIRSAEALIGRQAQRVLREGAPLREFDIAAPTAIKRGETIPIMYQAGALVLIAQARALQDGVAGERIRFVNLQSNRTIEALVTGPGRAEVGRSTYAQGRTL